jgi:hypothetical protein
MQDRGGVPVWQPISWIDFLLSRIEAEFWSGRRAILPRSKWADHQVAAGAWYIHPEEWGVPV